MVLGKYIFSHNIEQIIVIFVMLHDAGLKVSATKCIFGLKDIYYLGCIITQEGIKLNPKNYKGSWVSEKLPKQLDHERLLGWYSTTGKCGPSGTTY